MNFRRRSDDDVEVSLTPLIDVVFLLLIFFMVSTTFDHQSELNIDLPQASGEIQDTENKAINISIDASGQVYLNQQRLKDKTIDSLIASLKSELELTKEPQVLISADKNTPHQSVMMVMDAARRLNINKLTFAAVKPD